MGTSSSSLSPSSSMSKTISSSNTTTSLSVSPSTSTTSLTSTSNAAPEYCKSILTPKNKSLKSNQRLSKNKLKDDIKLWPLHTPNGSGKLPKKTEQHVSSSSATHQQRWTHISNARLIVREPTDPNGIALLIVAGGGYNFIMEKESEIPAKHFAIKGFYTFELIYRLPKETGYKYAPFQDAQRAIRVIRSYGKQKGHLFNKIGGIGFSAGGHLLAVTAVRNLGTLYAPHDMIDEESDELDFVALLYPVINMLPPYDVTQAYDNIIGCNTASAAATTITTTTTTTTTNDKQDDIIHIIKEDQQRFSPHLHVNSQTPPLYIVHAGDDNISPVMNSIFMYQATLDLNAPIIPHTLSQSDQPILSIKTPSHLTIFQTGGHGFRMGNLKKSSKQDEGNENDDSYSTDDFDMTSTWPDAFLAWLKLNKLIINTTKPTTAAAAAE